MTEIKTTEFIERLTELFSEIPKALENPTADSFRQVSMRLEEFSGTFAFASGYLMGLSEAKSMIKEVTKKKI